MNLIFDCILLVLCGAGIGAAINHVPPKAHERERARREAERLYNRLMREMEGAA